MAEISKINIGGIDYNIKDTVTIAATVADQKFTGTANQTVSVSGSTSCITATLVYTSTDLSQISASSKVATFA